MPALANAANSVSRLAGRMACNRAHSSGFLDFVLAVLDVRADDEVLDLGPGLGGQLIPVAERARRVVGLDVSAEMVAALRGRLAGSSAVVIEGDMDALARLDVGAPFSLGYAVYSLHYSRDPGRVVRAVDALLAGAGARFVVVTPDTANNAGWFADLGQLYDVPADALAVADFGRRAVLPAFHAVFPAVACATFQACVRFQTLAALMDYYDACAPYCRPDRRDAARRYFGAKIERDGGYEIDKQSLALVGRKG